MESERRTHAKMVVWLIQNSLLLVLAGCELVPFKRCHFEILKVVSMVTTCKAHTLPHRDLETAGRSICLVVMVTLCQFLKFLHIQIYFGPRFSEDWQLKTFHSFE